MLGTVLRGVPGARWSAVPKAIFGTCGRGSQPNLSADYEFHVRQNAGEGILYYNVASAFRPASRDEAAPLVAWVGTASGRPRERGALPFGQRFLYDLSPRDKVCAEASVPQSCW